MAKTNEEKILTFSTKLPFLEEDKNSIQDILSQKINWEVLINLASSSGIFPLMAKNILDIDNDYIPRLILEENLNQCQIEYTLNDIVLWEESKKIIRIAKEKQIPIIYFKGVVLKAILYDNLSLRKTSDIDILIKKEYLPKIETELLNLGYTLKPEEANNREFVLNTHFHLMLEKKTLTGVSVGLELHWDILPYVAKINNLVEDFWQNAQHKIIQGEEILTLSLEDILFESIIEIYKDITCYRPFLMKRHLDISQILHRFGREINWDEFIKRARRYHMSNLVYYVLSANQTLFNHKIPSPDILNRISPPFIKKILISKIIQNVNSLETEISYQRYLFYLLICEVILLNRPKAFLLKTIYLFYPKINLYKRNARINYIALNTLNLIYRLIRKIMRNFNGRRVK